MATSLRLSARPAASGVRVRSARPAPAPVAAVQPAKPTIGAAPASVFGKCAVRRARGALVLGGRRAPVPQPPAAAAADIAEEDTKTTKERGLILAGLTLAMILSSLDKVNMSVALVPMAAEFGWSGTTKGLVSSSFFWGYTFTQLPGGYLSNKIGGRKVLFWGVLVWSLGTLIAPMCAATSLPLLYFSRFLVGLGEGVAPSACTGVMAQCVPKQERSKAVTTVFGGNDLGAFVGLLVAPAIIGIGGWQLVFYLFGVLGIIWSAGCGIFNPKQLQMPAKGAQSSETSEKVPFGAFFSSTAVWAIIVAHFVWNYFYYTLMAYLPSFFAGALKFNLAGSSFLSLLPYICTIGMLPVAGSIADKLVSSGKMSQTGMRKLTQSIGFVGPCVCLTAIGLILEMAPGVTIPGSFWSCAVVALMGAAFACGAWTRTGLFCNHQDLSPKYASVLLGITNTAAAIGSLVGTLITGILLDMYNGSWAFAVAFPCAAFCALGTVTWLALCKAEPTDFDAIAKSA
mmetsp:Transcript_27424/g.89767  ORF Transcript_27424/g.89767 Transcript_27424/m.89767 type:complete len:512 (-) Transcript_27424:1675-3210(-)